MAFDVSPANLFAEVKAAEDFRDLHLAHMQEMIENYTGPAYRSNWSGSGWPENHPYEYIRLTTAKIIFDNPKVRVKTRRPGTQRFVAKAMMHGMNRWIRDVALRRILKRTYVAELFSYAVIQTTVEHQPWQDPRDPSVKYWPNVYTIDSPRFFFDPLCTWFGSGRFAGHMYLRDKEDIMKEAREKPEMGWDQDAIEGLSEESGRDQVAAEDGRQESNVPPRKELAIYEVWVPEIDTLDPNDGFHGTIYTISASGERKGGATEVPYLRKERGFYGPRWGPYSLFGVYPVPTDPFPLSPLAATYSQVEELNSIVKAVNTAIRKYSKVILYDVSNPDLGAKLKETPDSFVIGIRGFQKDQVEVVERGGITPNHVAQIAQAIERVDRNTGISSTQRGQVTPRATATAVAVADESSSDMIAFVKQEFADATTMVLNSVGWYMYHDDRIEFPLGEDAAAEMGMGEPWFHGGSHDPESGARYDDLELEIEPYSMQRMNEALRQAQYKEMLELAIQAAPVIPTAPFYDWKLMFEKGGEVLNDPRFGEFYDEVAAAEYTQAGMANNQEPRAEFSKQSGGGGGSTTRATLKGELTGEVMKDAMQP